MSTPDRKHCETPEGPLRVSGAAYRMLFEANPLPMWVIDRETLAFLAVNQAAVERCGCSREEFLSMTLKDIRPPEDIPRCLEAVRNFVSDKDFKSAGRWRHRKNDGTLNDVEVAARPLMFAGRPACLAIVNDLTERRRAEEALRQSEERFRTLVESMDDIVFTLDRKQRHRGVFGSWLERYGVAPQVYLGKTAREVLGADAAFVHEAANERALAGHNAIYEWSAETPKGRVYFQTSVSPLRNSKGSIVGIVGIGRDITALKQAEKVLHESEQRFSKVFRASPAAIAVGTVAEGRLLDVNDRWAEFFGYRRDELIGRTATELNLWARPLDCEQFIQKLRAEGSVRSVEAKFRRKSGEISDALLSMEIIEISDEGQPVILTMLNDVTERKKTEESLWQLSVRLLQLQDEERRRIARELHDSTAQILAGLAMNLTSVNDSAATLDPKVRKVLSDSLALAEQCTREIRSLSYLLHPPLLDEVGLVSALRWYTKGFAERSGIRVDFEVFPELGRLPPETETALFRIVQECLSNILRHSGSPTARIRMYRKPTEIVLEVRDEGKGMDPEVLEKARGDFNALGVGIAGMRERLRQLGGHLEIDSGKWGTMVKAILSIQQGNL